MESPEFKPSTLTNNQRLLSLDFFRGLTMFLLAAESAGVHRAVRQLVGENSLWSPLVEQFEHHAWHGLRFWDLVQPFFMFIVGVAMAYSLRKRWARGESWRQTFAHIVYRCAILLLLGIGLHCGYNNTLVWELWNVLAQLSFTILIAFLICRLPARTQLGISFALIALTSLLYRFSNVQGYDQPFVIGKNFGSWLDMILMGKINDGGWVAINCLPTAAHTIWGVLAGQLLMSDRPGRQKARILLVCGTIGIAVGYGLDVSGVEPIIKRICTSSFVTVSGGWALIALAVSYLVIDVGAYKTGVAFFSVVGMNSIFIYVFGHTVGSQWFDGFVGIFTNGALTGVGVGDHLAALVTAFVVLGLEWRMCHWFYKKNILIRI